MKRLADRNSDFDGEPHLTSSKILNSSRGQPALKRNRWLGENPHEIFVKQPLRRPLVLRNLRKPWFYRDRLLRPLYL
jgi:hypothetical protein